MRVSRSTDYCVFFFSPGWKEGPEKRYGLQILHTCWKYTHIEKTEARFFLTGGAPAPAPGVPGSRFLGHIFDIVGLPAAEPRKMAGNIFHIKDAQIIGLLESEKNFWLRGSLFPQY